MNATTESSATASKPTFRRTAAQRRAIKLAASGVLHLMLYGGSRSGKTFLLLYLVIYRALKSPGSRHCILRRYFNSIKRSIVYDTFPKVMKVCYPGVEFILNRSDWYVRFPNGSEIWFGGLDDDKRADKILGNEYATLYFNEASEIDYDAIQTALSRLAQNCPELKNRVFYDCNPPNKRHWLYTLFIEELDPESKEPVEPSLYACQLMNPNDNRANLPEGYIEQVLASLPRKKRQRFLEGLFTDDAEGALWRRPWIDDYRVQKIPQGGLKRIVVAVDPAVSTRTTSDDTGIVVCGQGYADKYYVLEDRTLKGTPAEWGGEVVAAYRKWQADCIVAEVNNGGDLVVSNIHNIDKNIRVIKVHASRGKAIRAEPVAGLSERGLIHFVGSHVDLEDELCTWNPETDEKSPNHLDAFVWGITELSGGESFESAAGVFEGIGAF